MASSKIIKDLANSTIDTTTALKRAKVLFSELNNNELIDWVNHELTGYPDDVVLPDYRIECGNIVGTYMVGTVRSHLKYTEASIPLGKMPEDLKQQILSIEFREGVTALKQLADEHKITKSSLGKMLPADFFPVISKYNSNPYMVIASAKVIIGAHCIDNIFSVIENRLLDGLILLEKEFGNLDDLDLNASTKTTDDIEKIANRIIVIVYNDQSVRIGDNNKIKNSSLGVIINDKE